MLLQAYLRYKSIPASSPHNQKPELDSIFPTLDARIASVLTGALHSSTLPSLSANSLSLIEHTGQVARTASLSVFSRFILLCGL